MTTREILAGLIDALLKADEGVDSHETTISRIKALETEIHKPETTVNGFHS
jgi:hypothetical protein